ncbi:MAG: helix-turn-helix domain-containing protein [Steroidobacter sp.]
MEEGSGLWALGAGQRDAAELSVVHSALPAEATHSGAQRTTDNTQLSNSLELAERDLILDALRTDNGNRQSVAKRLGISPRTLRYKLAKLREAGVVV